VLCLDRDIGSAEQTVSQMGSRRGASYAAAGDVTHPPSVHAAFAGAVGRFGQVHAVVNCAGVQGPLGLRSHEVALEDFDSTYTVNLRGALVVSQVALVHMLEHHYGRIVHVASIAGKEATRTWSPTLPQKRA